MRRCHGRGGRGFSPGPPEGTQSFNNYAEILLFARVRLRGVRLFVGVRERKETGVDVFLSFGS